MKDKAARKRASSFSILPEFSPLDALWRGSKAAFPSEQSARWAVRMHRRALAEAGALALLRGRIFVHQVKFAQVIEVEAINAMRQRDVRHAG